MIQLVFNIFLGIVFTLPQNKQPCKGNYVPLPKNCQDGTVNRTVYSPCTIGYHLKVFNCQSLNVFKTQQVQIQGFEYVVNIEVKDGKLQSAFNVEQQAYELQINEQGIATIRSNFYVGFVRGLQAWTQTIQISRAKKKNVYQYVFLPIKIKDQPQFIYRGIMADTARHYLPYDMLLKTIDSLMYSKMNILHWHITDQDSFPLILDSHPQIAKYAAFSQEQVYTAEQARYLVHYAMVRGVRVIPQLDSPGHAASWGKSPQLADIACTFGKSSFMGPLDVTLQKTYQIVKDVFTEVNDIFSDPIVHLGGDQVSLSCTKNASEVQKKHNIQRGGLQIQYYRKRQRQIIKQINPDKVCMYWINNKKIQLFDTRDVVHWWGSGLGQFNFPNPIVISYYGKLYLDMGVGNYYGNNYGSYFTWLGLYNINVAKDFQNKPFKKQLLGSEGPLWSQSSNQYTHFQKLWARSFSIAQRSWNSKVEKVKPGVLRRFTSHERRLNKRGIPTSPITSQQCQTHANFC